MHPKLRAGEKVSQSRNLTRKPPWQRRYTNENYPFHRSDTPFIFSLYFALPFCFFPYIQLFSFSCFLTFPLCKYFIYLYFFHSFLYYSTLFFLNSHDFKISKFQILFDQKIQVQTFFLNFFVFFSSLNVRNAFLAYIHLSYIIFRPIFLIFI